MNRDELRKQAEQTLLANGITRSPYRRHRAGMYEAARDILDRELPELTGREYMQARQVAIELAGGRDGMGGER